MRRSNAPGNVVRLPIDPLTEAQRLTAEAFALLPARMRDEVLKRRGHANDEPSGPLATVLPFRRKAPAASGQGCVMKAAVAAKVADHTCSVCLVTYENTDANRRAHNSGPTHKLRLYARCGAAPDLLRVLAAECEDALNGRSAEMTTAEYEAAFAELPHISGEIEIADDL